MWNWGMLFFYTFSLNVQIYDASEQLGLWKYVSGRLSSLAAVPYFEVLVQEYSRLTRI